jgi:signal transduction histidine kinase
VNKSINSQTTPLEAQVESQQRAERLIAMGEMAASLAHELRNPLGSIELHAGLIKKNKNSSEALQGYAAEIQKAVQTLNHIISNSLQFTKEIKPRKQSFSNAKPLLSEICNYIKQGEAKRCELSELDLCWEDIGAEAFQIDPYLIGQVAINLLTNAIQARSLESGVTHTVLFSIDHSNSDFWIMTVRDSGQGIDKEDLEKIFDPFYTTKEKGTGLGLAVVHSIVKAHGGTITIDSSPKAGTSFSIKFQN